MPPTPLLELRAWDAATGKELFRHGTGPRATALAYSPDGRTLAVSCDGGTMHRIRDAGSGKEILKLTTGEEDLRRSDSIAFSPDGTRLAYVSEGGKVQIWDVTPDETRASRSPDLILKGNNATVSQVAWSADGRFVSASGQGGKIVTWQILAQDEHLAIKGTDETTWVGPTSAASANRFAAAFETSEGSGRPRSRSGIRRVRCCSGRPNPPWTVPGPASMVEPSSSVATALDWRTARIIGFEPMGPKRQSARSGSGTSRRVEACSIATREEKIAPDVGFSSDEIALSSDGRLLATIKARGRIA